jgi:hypothetical protein
MDEGTEKRKSQRQTLHKGMRLEDLKGLTLQERQL